MDRHPRCRHTRIDGAKVHPPPAVFRHRPSNNSSRDADTDTDRGPVSCALLAPDSYRFAGQSCPVQDRPRDAQCGGSASDAEVGRTIKVFGGDAEGLLAETLSIGPRPCQPRPNPLGDSGPFKLGQRGQHVELETTGRRRAVDSLPK